MGQQNSRKANDCGCGCNYERRRYECASSSTSSVQRYVSAVTERLAHRACACRARRPACVCTNYRRDRLPEVLTHLRRELDAIVLNSADETRESDNVQEVYVLSVGRNVDQETQSSGANEAAGGGERRPHIQVRQVVCGSELRALLLQRNPSPPLTPTAPHRVHTQVTVLTGEELGALLRRSVPPPPPPPHGRGSPLTSRVHTQVDYIHCLVPDLQEITACSFYWGKMDRYEAERLLDNKPEGTFLLRDSAQEEHLFSVSFRKYGRSLHARIEHYEHKFSFDSHDPAVFCAATVTGLIEHYKDPSCVMFFEPMLTAPLPRASAFSLQQLSRAAIVSHTSYDGVDKLPLPPRLRCYLKEYHYRQRVRVRSLDQSQPRTYEPFN